VADVARYTDYYAFGSLMPGRNSGSESYRYGFNGYENDNEVKNITGGHLDFAGYGYDPRIAKRWNVDPKFRETAWRTPYSYAGLNPITNIDRDGERDIYYYLVIDNKTGKAGLGTINNINTSRGSINNHYQIHFKNKDGIVAIDVSKKTFLQYTDNSNRNKNLTYFGEKKIADIGLFESLKGNTGYYNGPPEKTDIPATEQGEIDVFDEGFSNIGKQEGIGGGGIPKKNTSKPPEDVLIEKKDNYIIVYRTESTGDTLEVYDGTPGLTPSEAHTPYKGNKPIEKKDKSKKRN